MIYTLTGSNDFGRSQILHEIVAPFEAAHTDMAIERIDGEATDIDRMRESIQSLPFLTPRKLVILREPSKQKAFAEEIEALLKNIPETTDVIIIEPKLDKRLSYYKTLKKLTDFRDFPELDINGLAKWAVEYARQRGGKLGLPDARYLIERAGNSQIAIQNELDKLLLFNPTITVETIDHLTDRLPQSTVFELLDAAFAGRIAHAQALYAEQRDLRVEPQAIIAMITWQLHILAVVKMADGRPAEDIAKQAKLNPFVVRKTQSLARHMTAARLRNSVADLLVLDQRLKRSAIDADEAVQLYLLKMSDSTS